MTLDRLEDLLKALETTSIEIENAVLSAPNVHGRLARLEFNFLDSYMDRYTEDLRYFVPSLCARMAAMFPQLHLRSLLSVKFSSRDGSFLYHSSGQFC